MSAFNIVRFRAKPGHEQSFVDYHRNIKPDFKGFKRGVIVKTGDRTFCFVGEWASFQKIAAARPIMIGLLDGMRDMLEDLGNEIGVTDPVSGEVALELRVAKPKKAKAKTGITKKSKAKKRKSRSR